jgi:hypothetical protein
MATTEERLRILKMVQDGKISAEEAAHLITDLEERKTHPAPPPSAPTLTAKCSLVPCQGDRHGFR